MLSVIEERDLLAQAFRDVCDELGCEYDNEEALIAAHDLKQRAAAWQPIETAPKDGTEILLWTPCGVDVGWWTDLEPDGCQEPGHNPGWWGFRGETAPGGAKEHGFGGSDAWLWSPQNQPTHWMPLPRPPA